MNRSFISVILGGFGGDNTSTSTQTDKTVKSGGSTDGSFIMKNSEHVIIVPGYGMAVSQAQLLVKEMADLLKKMEEVSFAIHPVAGRMLVIWMCCLKLMCHMMKFWIRRD